MKIQNLVLSLLLSVAGCTTAPRAPDFFAAQDQFAANRELETAVYSDIAYGALLGHVVDSLLDMDCNLQETSRQFGVISAIGAGGWYKGSLGMPQYRAGCARHKVTVRVFESTSGQIRVRATFLPADPDANKTFQQLMARSIAQEITGETP